MFIAKDDEYMTSYANGVTTPCVVQSSNLNEELGQISVLSGRNGSISSQIRLAH